MFLIRASLIRTSEKPIREDNQSKVWQDSQQTSEEQKSGTVFPKLHEIINELNCLGIVLCVRDARCLHKINIKSTLDEPIVLIGEGGHLHLVLSMQANALCHSFPPESLGDQLIRELHFLIREGVRHGQLEQKKKRTNRKRDISAHSHHGNADLFPWGGDRMIRRSWSWSRGGSVGLLGSRKKKEKKESEREVIIRG